VDPLVEMRAVCVDPLVEMRAVCVDPLVEMRAVCVCVCVCGRMSAVFFLRGPHLGPKYRAAFWAKIWGRILGPLGFKWLTLLIFPYSFPFFSLISRLVLLVVDKMLVRRFPP
jgi:hypothetical protein